MQQAGAPELLKEGSGRCAQMSTDARTTSLIAMHSMYEKKNEEFWHNELAANTECHEALHTMQGETTG